MNKFNLLHYFFIFLAFLFLNENVAKSDYGTKKEKKGFKEIDLNKTLEQTAQLSFLSSVLFLLATSRSLPASGLPRNA